MMKCLYCGIDTRGDFCSEDHRIKAEDFQKSAEKNIKWLIAGTILPIFLFIPGIIFIDNIVLIMALYPIIMGLALIIFPIPTPWTTSRFGLIKSIRIIRIFGIGMILFGLVLMIIFA